jgi:hypothetical protein
MSYVIRVRERGSPRHVMLGDKCLTESRIRAVQIDEQQRAEDAAKWMLDHNDDLDSAQVVDVQQNYRVIARFTAPNQPGDTPAQTSSGPATTSEPAANAAGASACEREEP